MQRDQPGDPAIREESEAFTARLREDLIRNGDLSIVGETSTEDQSTKMCSSTRPFFAANGAVSRLGNRVLKADLARLRPINEESPATAL